MAQCHIQHRILQQRRAGARARRRGRTSHGFVVGMPVAPPRRGAPRLWTSDPRGFPPATRRADPRDLPAHRRADPASTGRREFKSLVALRNSYRRMVSRRVRSDSDAPGWAAPPSLTDTTWTSTPDAISCAVIAPRPRVSSSGCGATTISRRALGQVQCRQGPLRRKRPATTAPGCRRG